MKLRIFDLTYLIHSSKMFFFLRTVLMMIGVEKFYKRLMPNGEELSMEINSYLDKK